MEKAVLVGLDLNNNIEYKMEELKNLAEACCIETVFVIIQKANEINNAFYVGSGKVKEIKMACNTYDADIVIFIETAAHGCVRTVFFCEDYRAGELHGKKRMQKSVKAGIRTGGFQKLRMKNNIFIFHDLIRQTADRVELSGQNEGNILRMYFIGCEIYGNRTAAFLNIDEFHLIMPVQRNLHKIQWHRA